MAGLDYGSNKSRGQTSGSTDVRERSRSGSTSYLAPLTQQARMANTRAFQNQQFDPYQQNNPAMQQGYGGLGQAGQLNQGYGQNMFANSAGYGGRAQQGFHRMNQYGQEQNPYMQQQINQYGGDIAQQYQRMIPGINAGFQNAGQRGGSRQGIAQGLAAQGAMQQFAQGVTDIRNNAYNTGAQMSAQQAQLGMAGQQGMAGLGMQGLGQMGDAYGQMGQYAQLGQDANQFGYNAQFQPFLVGAEVIGDPQTLQRSRSQSWKNSRTRNQGFTRGSGENIGVDF